MSPYYQLTDNEHLGLYVKSLDEMNALVMVKGGELDVTTKFYLNPYHYRDSQYYDAYKVLEDMPEDYVETMEALLEKAIEIAKDAHEGQVDKNGVPYFKHVEAVAEGVQFTEEKIIAYLHDTLEDTALTEKDLKEVFPSFVVETVKILTRDKELETYEAFIDRVCKSDLATPIKISDIKHNLGRPMKEPNEKLTKRYKWALYYLGEEDE